MIKGDGAAAQNRSGRLQNPESLRIAQIQRVVSCISIQIEVICLPRGIRGEVTTEIRAVVAVTVVVDAGFGVFVLAREAEGKGEGGAVRIRIPFDVGLAEGTMAGAPDGGTGAVGEEPGGVEVVGVDVVGGGGGAADGLFYAAIEFVVDVGGDGGCGPLLRSRAQWRRRGDFRRPSGRCGYRLSRDGNRSALRGHVLFRTSGLLGLAGGRPGGPFPGHYRCHCLLGARAACSRSRSR